MALPSSQVSASVWKQRTMDCIGCRQKLSEKIQEVTQHGNPLESNRSDKLLPLQAIVTECHRSDGNPPKARQLPILINLLSTERNDGDDSL